MSCTESFIAVPALKCGGHLLLLLCPNNIIKPYVRNPLPEMRYALCTLSLLGLVHLFSKSGRMKPSMNPQDLHACVKLSSIRDFLPHYISGTCLEHGTSERERDDLCPHYNTLQSMSP